MLHPGRWGSLLRMAAGLLLLTGADGCAHGRGLVTGRITPEHFRFKTVVAADSRNPQPAGWRAVCIHARMTEGDSGATDLCKFEVGIPIRNTHQQEVPLSIAQQIAATVANDAARSVLSKARPGELIAVLCRRFKLRYQELLQEEISGARVSQCEIAGLEIVYFDIPGRMEPYE